MSREYPIEVTRNPAPVASLRYGASIGIIAEEVCHA